MKSFEQNKEKFIWLKKAHEHYRLEQYHDVILACNQALQIEPDNRDALRGKARALLKLERYKEAHEVYCILRPSQVIGMMVPYSWGFKERPQSDFYKW